MAEDKVKKARQARTPKPVYAVMVVKDNDGNTINLSKENVEILSVHKDADALLNLLDSGGLPNGSFYKRISLT